MCARLCGRRAKRLSFCAESFLFTISGTCRLADSSYRMRGDPLNEEVLDWVEPDFSCLASVQSYYLTFLSRTAFFPPSLRWTGLIFLSPCTLQALCITYMQVFDTLCCLLPLLGWWWRECWSETVPIQLWFATFHKDTCVLQKAWVTKYLVIQNT